MNRNPTDADATNNAPNQDDAKKSKNEKLRALLDGLELTPEQTKDDVVKPSNRDSEILRDVPPHHGT